MGTLSVDKILKTSTGAAEFTLPATDGTAGQVMQTDGSGQLSLADVGTGGNDVITANAVGTTQIAAGAVTSNEMAANAIVTTAITDANVTPAKMSGPVPGAKNLIINGNFDVWQRGTSFTGANDWTADRWLIHANGTSPSTTQQTFTPGQTDVPNFPKYYLRYNAGTSPSAVGEVNQRIEDVTVLGGQEITFTIWAKAASGTPNLGLAIIQNFGSGGSTTNVQLDNATLWTLSTSWQKFTHTITIDSISGKTVGAGSYTQFRIKMAQDAINKDVAQVQVERGAVSTTFEHNTFGQELLACQRYFETSYNTTDVPGVASLVPGFAYSTNNGNVLTQSPGAVFKVTKRSNPTIVVYNGVTGASGKAYRTSDASSQTVTGSHVGQSAIGYLNVPSSENGYIYHYTADSEL